MALVIANRVQETTTTTGTGTVTLAGAVAGFQSFAVVGNTNTTYYTLTSGTNWEVGIGTYSTTGPTLARTTILSSSAAGAAITLAGTSTVFSSYPAEKVISDGYGLLPIANGGTNATTAGGALTSLGAYPAANPSGFTSNTGTVTSVNLTAGTGVSVSGGPVTTSGAITVTNTAPDQVVSLTGAGTTVVSGTYPNFTITSTDSAAGTVTSVGGTGTVSGLTLTGTVTTSGSLTLGGTLAVTPSNFASQTANTVLAAPNGAAGVPTFRAIVAADIPTLNQNTTGTASNVTGTVAVANGGTGATTAPTALTNLGAYPAANPSGFTSNTGTVTSVGGTGTVSGLTLSGTVTTSGNLTLGGTLSLTSGNVTTALGFTPYNATNPSGFITSSGNAATATNLSTDRTNWSTNGTITAVVGQLAWKNYSNNHTIFDASASTAPDGSAVSNTNAAVAWSGTYPTLMGWNGATTYGVRVDSARLADNSTTVGGFTPSATAGVANRVVVAHAAGYIFNNYFNSTDNAQSTGVTAVMVKAGDDYYRSGTAAAIATFISGQSMNISGSSTTAGNVTGTVAVANGGTGATTLTANNVLLGNGTSAVQVVAPSTSGNLLTSNGTTWVSSALATAVQEFSASDTWTKPTGAKFVMVECWGAGGGGGSGGRGAAATSRSGGGAGGGGAYTYRLFSASSLSATETVTIGAGGTAGAARTTDGTSNAGGNGGNTSFGSQLFSYGGGGANATGTGGDGGGVLSAANLSTSAGEPLTGQFGGADAPSSPSGFGGASGATGNSTLAGASGGCSYQGGAGGGAAGGIGTGNTTRAGGDGGFNIGATGGGGAGGATAGSGNAGTAGTVLQKGGGGGASGNTAGTVAGGTGGAGGPAAGGGGGGGSTTGANSGAGGLGGAGFCRVYTW